MSDKSHIVQKHIFKAEYDSEPQALDFRHRFASLIRSHLLPVEEKVFDKVNSGGETIRINTLTIDLGEVDEGEMESVLPSRLADMLYRRLKDKIQKLENGLGQNGEAIISQETLLLDALLYYFQTGTMPWWGRQQVAKGFSLSQIFEKLMELTPSVLYRRLSEVLKSKEAQGRFAKQISDDLIFRYLKNICPENVFQQIKEGHRVVIPLTGKLSTTFKKRVHPATQFWNYTLNWLLVEGAPDISSQIFQGSLIQHVLQQGEVNIIKVKEQFTKIVRRLSEEEKSLFTSAVAEEDTLLGYIVPLVVEKGSIADDSVPEEELKWFRGLTEAQRRAYSDPSQNPLPERGHAKRPPTQEEGMKYFSGSEDIGQPPNAEEGTNQLSGTPSSNQPMYAEGSGVLSSPQRTGQFTEAQWVGHLTEVQFLAFIQRRLPSEYLYVTDFVKEIIKVFRSKGVRLTHNERFVRVVWEAVVYYLQVVKTGDFEKSAFLQVTLDYIGHFLHLNLKGMLHYLGSGFRQLRDLPSLAQEGEVIGAEMTEEGTTEEGITEEAKQQAQIAVLKYYLIFGVLPNPSALRHIHPHIEPSDLGVENVRALVQVLFEMRPDEAKEVFESIDPLVFPAVIRRLRLQLPSTLMNQLFGWVPRLKWAEIIEKSFTKPYEHSLKELSSVQGSLTAMLESWVQEVAQAVGPRPLEEGERDGAVPDRELALRYLQWSGDQVGEELIAQLGREQLYAALRTLLRQPGGTSGHTEHLIRTVTENTLEERVRSIWVEQLPETVLMALLQLIKPHSLDDFVAWVDLYIARRVKEEGYRNTFSELKQLKWKLLFESSPEIIKRMLEEQQKTFEREEKEKKKIEKKSRDEQLAASFGKEPVYVNNAGLVIFHPYLQRFFKMLGLLEKGKFIDDEAAHKAVYLLHYLVYKDQEMPEYEMTLNKLLCGLEVNTTLEEPVILEDKEKELAESLIDGVVANWKALGNSSADNFRVSFLHREGKLEKTLKGTWQLEVGQKGYDVLMERLPWSFSIIKLPWMLTTLYVQWGDKKPEGQ